MILELHPNDSRLNVLENSPGFWRKNWSTEHLDRMVILLNNGKPVGRVGVYLNPFFAEQAVAFLGAFEAINDYQVSQKILAHAVEYLKEKGITQIVGPIDGSTWQQYRFREKGDYPPFFLEPTQAEWYVTHWEKFGFAMCQQYQSNRMKLADADTSILRKKEKYLLDSGIQLRNFDIKNGIRELQLLAAFNQNAFQNNFLFSPAPTEKFVNQYRPLLPVLDPDLICLAEDEHGLAGLVFALPDHLGKKGESAIIKTLARRPEKKYAGLGAYLSHWIIDQTRKQGYQYLIHALMRSDNTSLVLSKRMQSDVYSRHRLFQFS